MADVQWQLAVSLRAYSSLSSKMSDLDLRAVRKYISEIWCRTQKSKIWKTMYKSKKWRLLYGDIEHFKLEIWRHLYCLTYFHRSRRSRSQMLDFRFLQCRTSKIGNLLALRVSSSMTNRPLTSETVVLIAAKVYRVLICTKILWKNGQWLLSICHCGRQ